MTEQTAAQNISIGEALDYATGMAEHGNHEAAITLLRGVLVHDPDNVEAINRMGAALFALKQYEHSFYWFWRLRKAAPRNPMALTNYGLCLGQLGQAQEGLPDLERAIYHAKKMGEKFTPQAMAMLYNNLGNSLERLERYEDALKALDTGLKHRPDDGFTLYTRGVVLLRLNRQQDAIESFDRALAINPNDYDALYNRGMARLRLGQMKRGFADYEARLVTTENKVLNLGLPPEKKWTGQTLTGKKLLIHGEQGLGDDIQFMRFIPPLLERHAPGEVKLIVHSATKPLMADLGVELLNTGAKLPDYDYWVALMSLPHMLGTEEHTIPQPLALPIDAERIADWKKKIDAESTGRMRVAICWAGNFQHKNDRHRSIPLEMFATLFNVDNCEFVSLQQFRPEDMAPFAALQAKYPRLKACNLEDLRDTAAAIMACDVVVSVDTAVAHLAGTLNKPTIVLVPKMNCDWRWQTGRSDTPWYPNMTIYRQTKVGQWLPTLHALRDDLESQAEGRRAA